MNRTVLTHLGGFGLTQERLDFQQQNYLAAFAAIAKLCGDKVILHGVVSDGSNVTDGWIAYNGELIRFEGGSLGPQVILTETSVTYVYGDASSHIGEVSKKASCGLVGGFPFSDLKKLETLSGLEKWLPGDVKMVSCNDAYITANFDGTGLGINERTGWAIMNGANGTADWRGKFLVAYNNADADYDSMADGGGSKTHVVNQNNIQEFTISKPGSAGTSGVGNPVAGDGSGDGTVDYKVGVPSPTPIDHRPPFKISLYLQKL